MAKKAKPVEQPKLLIQNKRSKYKVHIPADQFYAHAPDFRAEWTVLEGEVEDAPAPDVQSDDGADEAEQETGE